MSKTAPKALVTGGTGFVGSHMVDTLIEAGYSVRCTVRARSNRRWLTDVPVELVEADLTRGDLSDALAGVDVVFHFAGLTRGPESGLMNANRDGTLALLEAAAAEGTGPRFVYCSSQAAAGPSAAGAPRSEEDPPTPTTDYGRSKLAGEEAVTEYRERLHTVILRPGAIYGPRDEDTLPVFKMSAAGLMVIPGIRDRRVQMVHVRDVARAALLSASADAASGRIYNIAHPEILTWADLTRTMSSAMGRRVRGVRVPSPILRGVGAAASALGAGKRSGEIDKRRAADLTQLDWTCTVERAREELSWRPEYDAERGLKDTAEWYRSVGWI